MHDPSWRVQQEFGEFFLALFRDHLSKHEVVHVTGLGYFWLEYREGRIGTNPMTGEKVPVPAMENVFEFLPEEGDHGDLSPEELVASLERHHIPLVEVVFPEMRSLLDLLALDASSAKPKKVAILVPEGELLVMKKSRTRRMGLLEDGGGEVELVREDFSIRRGDVLKELIHQTPPSTLCRENAMDPLTSTGTRAVGLKRCGGN